MALVQCHECSKEISTEATSCPNCGAKSKRPAKTKWWLWIPLSLVAAFFTIGFIAASTPEGMARAEDRSKIEYCWGETKDPSFDSGTSRFIASACQKMEDEYVAKYGRKP